MQKKFKWKTLAIKVGVSVLVLAVYNALFRPSFGANDVIQQPTFVIVERAIGALCFCWCLGIFNRERGGD
jgi:hypothetical protein